MINWKIHYVDTTIYLERFLDVLLMKEYLKIGPLYFNNIAFWGAKYLYDWKNYSICITDNDIYNISPPPAEF